MNMDMITLEDCLLNYEVNNKSVIINDGKIIDFEDSTDIPLYTVYIVKD